MAREWFASWFDSPYYHILYQSHDDNEARHFIDKLLRPLALPGGARLLDLACGKGRHARYLAEKGYVVTGLDISPASIAYARHFEYERLSFFQHDMRLPFRINYFDGILNIFTSFGYFDTDQDHLATLINVYKGLKPGGLFLLDYFNANWVRQNLVRHETKILDGISFHLTKTIRSGWVHKRVQFVTGGRKFTFRERVRLFGLEDFQQMFKAAGLEMREYYGDYDLQAFDPAVSKRLILIAQKPA
ncbi:MAG: class I SAM-dependent methyltransferase [Bacteroidetes bacterium]|nr:MAG: class I SAM-dependent methyltransferase [Bacteroidota bacterium]